jgi:SAM-dependent methyltransferase
VNEYGVGDIGVDSSTLIFDIGCGSGEWGLWLAGKGATVVFVDPNIEPVKKTLADADFGAYVFGHALGDGDGEVSMTALVQSLGIPHIVRCSVEAAFHDPAMQFVPVIVGDSLDPERLALLLPEHQVEVNAEGEFKATSRNVQFRPVES